MPALYAGKSARSSKKATKDSSELADSKPGRALSIKRTLKPDKSGTKAKSALPAELDGAGQREKSKDQDWDIDSLFATVKKAKKISTAAKVIVPCSCTNLSAPASCTQTYAASAASRRRSLTGCLK